MTAKNRRQGRSLLDSIPVPKLEDQKIKFSFEFYDSGDKYCISSWSQTQIKRALECLKDISSKNFTDLQRSSRVYHFGEVDWSKTTEKSGFPDQKIKQLQAFHFALLGVNGQKTRVYGGYAKGTFYIVWFDLNHEIWPVPLRNT